MFLDNSEVEYNEVEMAECTLVRLMGYYDHVGNI